MIKEVYNIYGIEGKNGIHKIENTVKNLDGVKSCNINYLTKSMSVQYNDDEISRDIIIEALKKLNCDIKLKTSENNSYAFNFFRKKNEEKKKRDRFFSRIKLKVILNIIFLYFLIYMSISHTFGFYMPDFMTGYENSMNFALTQMLLTLPILYLNRNYYIDGFKNLVSMNSDVSVLIFIGSGTAFCYGIVNLYMVGYGLGHNDASTVNLYVKSLYFEFAAMIPVLMSIGRLLEGTSKKYTNAAVEKILNLIPEKTEIIKGDNSITTFSKDVMKGDIVLIKAGNNIPVDGIIIEGSASLDESLITGESMIVEKKPGDNLISGTLCVSGYLKMRATAVGEETTIEKISSLVNDAIREKTVQQKITDKIAGILVPLVIIFAIFTFIYRFIMTNDIGFSLSNAISVLVISCPGALSIAMPMSIFVGSGVGLDNGILVKNISAFTDLKKIDTVVFDKTGTLTKGEAEIVDIVCFDRIREIIRHEYNYEVLSDAKEFLRRELLIIAYSLERQSMHSLALAVNKEAEKRSLNYYEIEDFVHISGAGISAEINKRRVYAGSASYISGLYDDGDIYEVCEDDFKAADEYMKKGQTAMFIALKEGIIGFIVVADGIKKDSVIAVKEFIKRGKDVILLTGDNEITAKAIADELNIRKVFADMVPSSKEEKIKELKEEGKKVLMIGDGINDSPALACADIGMAIGAGADIAIDAADIVLMHSDVLSAVSAFELSKKVVNNIKENLFLAIIYHVIGIPIATGIFYDSFGLVLNPVIATALMSLSSILIISNALRIRTFRAIKGL